MLLNCDLLFALAEELKVSEADWQKINGILHPNGNPIFLTEALDAQYYSPHDAVEKKADFDIEFAGTSVILPAVCCTADAEISVSVSDAKGEASVVLTDWTINSVERPTEGELATYRAIYTSEAARHHDWQPGEIIQIEIQPKAGADLSAYCFGFTVDSAKKRVV